MPENWDEQAASNLIAELKGLDGALMPLLHALQERFGRIDDEAVPLLARALNLSEADVWGVVTYYHDFRRTPAGRTIVKVCRAEACQANGCEDLAAALQARLGVPLGTTSADGAVTLEEIFCFGNCALGPNVSVGDRLIGRASAERVAKAVVEAGR